ncbi:MAG: alpha/beta hydrolase [Clostridia bacterium]|nr:alpha/beta hydrolase [Clostridia bacterium]
MISNPHSFSIYLSGLASQADYLFHPAKYNARKLKTAICTLPAPQKPVKEDYVQLSAVKMHYFVYGAGAQPLILVHGNACDAGALAKAAAYLANDYTVYVPESRCHGKSSDTDRITYHLMARDLKEFIAALRLEKPIIIGHSDGAINAITLAADYPEVPKAIIACGANSSPAQFKHYFTLFVKLGGISKNKKLNELMLTQPHFTPKYLAHITCPAYIVSGQFDIMWNADTAFIAAHIPGSDMVILKGENHSSYIMENGKKAYILARKWLRKIQ